MQNHPLESFRWVKLFCRMTEFIRLNDFFFNSSLSRMLFILSNEQVCSHNPISFHSLIEIVMIGKQTTRMCDVYLYGKRKAFIDSSTHILFVRYKHVRL